MNGFPTCHFFRRAHPGRAAKTASDLRQPWTRRVDWRSMAQSVLGGEAKSPDAIAGRAALAIRQSSDAVIASPTSHSISLTPSRRESASLETSGATGDNRRAFSCSRDCSQSGSRWSRLRREPRPCRSSSELRRRDWSGSSASRSNLSGTSRPCRCYGYSRPPSGRCRMRFHRERWSRILQIRSNSPLSMPVTAKSS